MNKKFSVLIAMLLVVALAVPTSAAVFTDVSSDHWAYEAVNRLVAAGVISGYPDGTFKGDKNLSRYEIAVVVDRVLDRVSEERKALANEVEAMKDGFTSAQKTELKDVVKSLIEKNMPEPKVVKNDDGLNEKEYEQIANLIEALTFNYKAELQNLGADMKDLEDLVCSNKAEVEETIAALEGRVADLEEPVVSFSGSYDVDFEHKVKEGTAANAGEVDYYKYTGSVDDPADTLANDSDLEAEYADEIVYSNPWDSDSDEIDFADNKGDLGQTLGLDLNIEKDGLNAVVGFDVTEGEDELYIDLAELALENDFLKGVYNEDNSVAMKDYAFYDAGFNGATVEFKDYGLNTFMGKTDVAVSSKPEKDDDDNFKYEYNSDDDEYNKITEDVEKSFYVLGAEKAFNFAGVDMNTVFATQRAVNADLYDTNPAYDDERRSVLGMDANTTMGIFDANFDMAYSMPVDEDADSDILTRMGVSSELDMADVEFNFRNKGEDFTALHSGGAAFDPDHDDYDKYVDGLDGVKSGYNFTVAPKLFDTVDTEMFYGSVTMNDDKADTKMSFIGETTLMDIDLTGEYTTTNVDEDDDKENTMDFGAEYMMMEDKMTATAGFTRVDPVEEDEEDGEVETTMSFGGEYEMNDYISANADYETITNVDFTTDEKSIMGFGADIEDYPVFGNLTTSAGFDYETIGKDYDETTIEYNLGLGYIVGAAEFDYDFTSKNKSGDDLPINGYGEGTYTTNEMGMTYEIVDGTDFTADYEVLQLVDSDDVQEYKVETATAGVSVSF